MSVRSRLIRVRLHRMRLRSHRTCVRSHLVAFRSHPTVDRMRVLSRVTEVHSLRACRRRSFGPMFPRPDRKIQGFSLRPGTLGSGYSKFTMTTQSRATLLGFGLAALSFVGTFCVLGLYFFCAALGSNSDNKASSTGLIIAGFALVLVPGLVLAGIGACLPIETAYKKAVALGFILPPFLICAYMGLTMLSVMTRQRAVQAIQRPTTKMAPRPGAR